MRNRRLDRPSKLLSSKCRSQFTRLFFSAYYLLSSTYSVHRMLRDEPSTIDVSLIFVEIVLPSFHRREIKWSIFEKCLSIIVENKRKKRNSRFFRNQMDFFKMLFDGSITLLEVIFRGVEIACIFLSIEKKRGGKWTIIIVDRIVVVFKFQKFEGNGERHSSLFRYFVTVHLGIVQPRRALSVIRRGTTIPNGRTGNERTRRRTKANARRREWLNRQSS